MDRRAKDILAAIRKGWEPFDRRSVIAWARDNIDLPNSYAIEGPFHAEVSRYLIFPLELLTNEETRQVNILAAVQTGKSLASEISLQYFMANRPGPAAFNLQNDDEALEHWETRLLPVGLRCPPNAEHFKKARKRKTLVQLGVMDIYVQGANLSNFQRKSIRYLFNSERWMWKPGMHNQAAGRTGGFSRNCKIVNESQGSLEGDDWDLDWNSGKRYHWGIECRHCGREHRLEIFGELEKDPDTRAGLVWDTIKNKEGFWEVDRAAETVRYRCPSCGHEYENNAKSWDYFNEAGRYLCVDPDRPFKNVSLRWNDCVKRGWEATVSAWLKAVNAMKIGNHKPTKEFFMKNDATFFKPKLLEKKVDFRPSAYAMKSGVPEWATHLFLVCDCQDGRGNDSAHYWAQAEAWSETGRSARLFYGRLDTKDEIRDLQLDFGIDDPRVSLDGGHKLLQVAGICADYNWSILVGSDKETFTHYEEDGRNKRERVERPFSKWDQVDPYRGREGQGRFFAWRLHWSNYSIKNILWNLITGNGPRYEWPEDLPEIYERQLFSETRKKFINPKTGKVTEMWVPLNPSNPNNHAWDVSCMGVVCALEAGLLPFSADDIKQPDEEPVSGEAATAPHDQPQQDTLALSES